MSKVKVPTKKFKLKSREYFIDTTVKLNSYQMYGVVRSALEGIFLALEDEEDSILREVSDALSMSDVLEVLSMKTKEAIADYAFSFPLSQDALASWVGAALGEAVAEEFRDTPLNDCHELVNQVRSELKKHMKAFSSKDRAEKAEETKAVTFLESRGYTVTKD